MAIFGKVEIHTEIFKQVTSQDQYSNYYEGKAVTDESCRGILGNGESLQVSVQFSEVCVCVCVCERERGLKRDLCGNVQETLGQEVEGSESRDTHQEPETVQAKEVSCELQN